MEASTARPVSAVSGAGVCSILRENALTMTGFCAASQSPSCEDKKDKSASTTLRRGLPRWLRAVRQGTSRDVASDFH